jgi:hypothetical protein
MTGAEILYDFLKAHDVKQVFGYPGGAILPVSICTSLQLSLSLLCFFFFCYQLHYFTFQSIATLTLVTNILYLLYTGL